MFDEYEFPDAGVFRGFEPDTFAFLGELRANNHAAWMAEQEQRYRRVLREPLRALFQALTPVAARLNPQLETDAKYGRVLSSIRRRWPDAAATYHDFLWGAFYRAAHTRHTDAQLFIVVRESGVSVGTGIDAGAQAILAQFRDNLGNRPDEATSLLHTLHHLIPSLFAEGMVLRVQTAAMQQVIDAPEGWDEFAQLAPSEIEALALERHFAPDDDLLYQPEFADEVSRLIERLYPVYRCLIGEAESSAAPTPIPAPRAYSWDQLHADTLLDPEALHRMIDLLHDKGQIVLYGPPGTGKTYIARRLAQFVVEQSGQAAPSETIRLVQFHPSYGYEEFIEGIRPQSDGGQITYPVEAGVFRRLCDEARQRPDRPYVLIIDEINRGNLPRIFGELLYLLDYRDPTEAVILPYSKLPFTLPRNVYLIGTMNTADRTLVALDQAARRRFYFVPLRPDPDVLRAWLREQGSAEMTWVADLLTELNRRLQADGIDWAQHIGHTAFMVRGLDERRVALIWEHSILTTLEEHFYNRAGWEARYAYSALRTLVHNSP
jgi:uncharacterized protein (DUF2461 family)